MKKHRKIAGETLTETLVSVLIVALVFLFLTGAVMSAAKVNEKARPEEAAFQKGAAESDSFSVTVSVGAVSETVDATLYKTGNGYYYYEKA